MSTNTCTGTGHQDDAIGVHLELFLESKVEGKVQKWKDACSQEEGYGGHGWSEEVERQEVR